MCLYSLRNMLAIGIIVCVCSGARAQTAVLFEDTFDGTQLDSFKWHKQENAGSYGPALHFDETLPYVENGYVRLPLETYDPAYPGQMVRGSYLQAGGPGAGEIKYFDYRIGPIRTEVRFRMVNPLAGQTTSLTYYGLSTGGGSDEMDFEYQSADPINSCLWLSTWESWDHNGRVAFDYPDLTGIINGPPAWNTYRLDWYAGRVEFYLNDQHIWTSMNYIPDDPMGLKLTNFIYANSTLAPVSDPAQNQVAYYDIDYVRVTQLDDQGDVRPETFLLTDNFDYHSAAQVDDQNLDLPQRQLGLLPMTAHVTYTENTTDGYVSDGEVFLDGYNAPPKHLSVMTYPDDTVKVTAEHDFFDQLAAGKTLHVSADMCVDMRDGTSDPTSNYVWMTVGKRLYSPGVAGTVGVSIRNNGTWYFNVHGDGADGSVPFVDEQWHHFDVHITPAVSGYLVDVELNGQLVVDNFAVNDPAMTEAYVNFGAYTYGSYEGQHWYGFDDLIVATTPVTPADCDEVQALGYGLATDFNGDCYVEWADFGTFAADWQQCMDPQDAGCTHPW